MGQPFPALDIFVPIHRHDIIKVDDFYFFFELLRSLVYEGTGRACDQNKVLLHVFPVSAIGEERRFVVKIESGLSFDRRFRSFSLVLYCIITNISSENKTKHSRTLTIVGSIVGSMLVGSLRCV